MQDIGKLVLTGSGKTEKVVRLTAPLLVGVLVVLSALIGTTGYAVYKLQTLQAEQQELAVYREQYAQQTEKLEKLVEDNDKMQKELAQVATLEAQVRELLQKDGEEVSRSTIDRVSQELDASGKGSGTTSASPLEVLASQNELTRKRIAYKRENLGNMLQQLSGLGGASGMLWPTEGGEISSYYGMRVDPFGGSYGDFHPGLDIAVSYGTPVLAAAPGVVEMAGWNGGYGQYVEIKHNDGLETAYGHMSALAVSAGARVKRGDTIGYVGSTGASTGPHVHFEVIEQGDTTNPLRFVQPK